MCIFTLTEFCIKFLQVNSVDSDQKWRLKLVRIVCIIPKKWVAGLERVKGVGKPLVLPKYMSFRYFPCYDIGIWYVSFI